MSTFDEQLTRMKTGQGFIAALDQSGGSTKKALKAYGVDEDAYSSDDEMFSIMHKMRTRIITNPAFTTERILGAILFENTLGRDIEGKPSATYLWEEKGVVPFLKVDKGMEDEANGVQLMKLMPDLDALLDRALEQPVFGTKMRSVIKSASEDGIKAIVEQQFELGKRISAKGLVPIIEPEVDIHAPDKAEAEAILKRMLMAHMDTLAPEELVMFKLTIPTEPNFYQDCMDHPNQVRIVALSGGYSREEANEKLTGNNGLMASFSRGLIEGLSASQTEEEFSTMIDGSIESIYQASIT